MKALLMRKPGDVVLTEYPTPVPGKNQVLVRIHAAGICVNDIRDYKGECDFTYPRIGGHEYAVRAVPDLLPSVMKGELLKEMIGSLSEEGGSAVPTLIIEKTASMSCKAAVKGNTSLSAGEAEKLLDELFALEDPYNCPHGRPTIIRLTRSELDRRFRRVL